jgi:drug/metabolite transporter (DMT)-like permease
MKVNTQSYIYALIAVLLWSTVATAFKIALNEINVVQLLTFSTGLSTLVLTIIMVLSKRFVLLKSIPKRSFFNLVGKGIINPFAYYLILFKAYSWLPANEAMILNYTWPIVLVVFTVLILKQQFSLFDGVSIVISFIGVLIIATQGKILNVEFSNLLGVLLALGSSIVWAFYWILNMKNSVDAIIQLWISFGVGFLASLFLFLLQKNTILVSPTAIIASIYVGLFEMSIPFIMWHLALNKASKASNVSQLIFLSPFLSLMIISVVLKEKILITSIIGFLFILVGIFIQAIFKKTRNP